MKQGGFLACRRMLETAAAAGLRVVVGHGFGLGITAAEIMLAATSHSVIDGPECRALTPGRRRRDIEARPSAGEPAAARRPGPGVPRSTTLKVQRYRLEPPMRT